jgi:hypothetical protein
MYGGVRMTACRQRYNRKALLDQCLRELHSFERYTLKEVFKFKCGANTDAMSLEWFYTLL